MDVLCGGKGVVLPDQREVCDLGLDPGSSDQNTVDKVMGKSFPAGRTHGRGPTPSAGYRKRCLWYLLSRRMAEDS